MAELLSEESLVCEVPFTTVEDGIDIDDSLFLNQPMIALQPVSEGENDEIKIEITEEVLDESNYEIPNIAEEQEISSSCSTPASVPKDNKKRKIKGIKSKLTKKTKTGNSDDEGATEIDVPRKWERKKVQIKTLEGEFSVTVWASGKCLFGYVANNFHYFNRAREKVDYGLQQKVAKRPGKP